MAILTSGGPAPGINSVISAATIEAINLGWRVLGVRDGYRGLVEDRVVALTLDDVTFIHFDGGSVLGMSRIDIREPQNLERILQTIAHHQIDMLLTIGGDGTASGAAFIAAQLGGKLRTVHVPKTIDNDLPLPQGVPTFGFTTARQVGVGLVQNLMRDARTCTRWYLVVTMGRQSGHLALGIAKAAGANLAIIPEEFEGNPVSFESLLKILEGAVIKSLARDRPWGVAVLAEGLVERMAKEDLAAHFPEMVLDDFNHVRLSDVRLGELMSRELEARLKARRIAMRFNEIKLGYELRCADPVPFDIEYTRDLGFAAVRFLAEGGTQAMVLIHNGRREVMTFDQLRDPETGLTRVRDVDIHGEGYLVARRYMQRLTRRDFEDERMVERLADAARVTPQAFREAFEQVVAHEPARFGWADQVRATIDL